MNNIRYALRGLRKNPGFALVAILTLGIGIGANTAILSAVDALMLHPLPFPRADELVLITKDMPMFQLVKSPASPLDFQDYRSLSHSFTSLAALQSSSYNLGGDREPVRIPGARVSTSLLPELGVQPVIGRVFTADEEHVVVLAEDLWQSRFGADKNILGRPIQLNNETFTVVGVVAPVLRFLINAKVYVPLAFTPAELAPNTRGQQSLDVIGRLKPGATLEGARADLKIATGAMTAHFPTWYPKGWSIVADPLAQSVAGELRTPLLVLLGAVAMVLLIGCANVANLLLARGSARQKEIAIRSALGASRMQVVRQLLTEGLVLGAIAGAVGLVMGSWALDLFSHYAPVGLLRGQSAGVTGLLALATFAVAMATSVLFGLAPAIAVSQQGLRGQMADSRGRLRGALVIGEVTLSLVLLASAGLLIRSFVNLQKTSPGFRTDRLLTARISLPELRYSRAERIRQFYSDLTARAATLPGVTSVALSTGIPFSGNNSGGSFDIVGRKWKPGEVIPDVQKRTVSPGYFEALEIPVRQGRTFAASDGPEAPKTAIVDETFARQFFPRGDAIGNAIAGPKNEPFRIVGVVSGVKDRNLAGVPLATIYFNSLQRPAPYMTLVIRTEGDARALEPAIGKYARDLDKNLALYGVATMDEMLADSLGRRRISTMLLAILAAIALGLAAIGIYGVISSLVNYRTREIGIRMALGASAGDVRALVLHTGMRPVWAGIIAGLGISIAAGRLLSSLLFDVAPADPVVLFAAAFVLICMAALANYLPARRATKVDPMVALRYE